VNDPGGYDLVFDQTGQQVDLQYNAESIMVVNHIADGRGGKRCPRCNAAPMRQTSLAWDENTRRVERGTMVLNYLALRVAPPRRPRPRVRPFPTRPYLKAFGVLAVLLLCGLGAGETSLIALSLAVIVGLAAFTAWRVRLFRAEQDADLQRVQNSTARYERHRERWRQSWFCSACGAKAVERKPHHRPPTDSDFTSTGQRGDSHPQRRARPRRRNPRPSRTD
jgi:hypothetical protein